MLALPEPECSYGYTIAQLHDILGEHLADFELWMYGQTAMLCSGERYNHDTQQYESDCDEPHGAVVYTRDLERYLQGRPVID